MVVKIVKSSEPNYWYNQFVGEYFKVEFNELLNMYELINKPDGIDSKNNDFPTKFMIKPSDCEITG